MEYPHWKYIFQGSIFRCYVSLSECKLVMFEKNWGFNESKIRKKSRFKGPKRNMKSLELFFTSTLITQKQLHFGTSSLRGSSFRHTGRNLQRCCFPAWGFLGCRLKNRHQKHVCVFVKPISLKCFQPCHCPSIPHLNKRRKTKVPPLRGLEYTPVPNSHTFIRSFNDWVDIIRNYMLFPKKSERTFGCETHPWNLSPFGTCSKVTCLHLT